MIWYLAHCSPHLIPFRVHSIHGQVYVGADFDIRLRKSFVLNVHYKFNSWPSNWRSRACFNCVTVSCFHAEVSVHLNLPRSRPLYSTIPVPVATLDRSHSQPLFRSRQKSVSSSTSPLLLVPSIYSVRHIWSHVPPQPLPPVLLEIFHLQFIVGPRIRTPAGSIDLGNQSA